MGLVAGIDRDEATALYRKAQELLLRDVPGVALFDMLGDSAMQKRFKGHAANPYYSGVVFFYQTRRE